MLKHYGAVYPKICFWPLMSRNACSNKNGRFDKTKQMFMDLTILVNFSQIGQREISLADLMILTNFFVIFITACISGYISIREQGEGQPQPPWLCRRMLDTLRFVEGVSIS